MNLADFAAGLGLGALIASVAFSLAWAREHRRMLIAAGYERAMLRGFAAALHRDRRAA